MTDVTKAQKDDYQRFFIKDPQGFSPERNKAIIEQSIKDYEAMRAQKIKERGDEYIERADAVVTYLKHLSQGHGNGNANMMEYFGRKNLAYLRGEQIRAEIMKDLSFKNKKGEIIKPKF